MTESQPQPKPWQIIEKARRWDAEKSRQNQQRILAAYDSLKAEGITEADGYQIARRDAELRGTEHKLTGMMPHGTLYRALHQLEEQGVLNSRWEREFREGLPPRRRLYAKPEEPEAATQDIGTQQHVLLEISDRAPFITEDSEFQ